MPVFTPPPCGVCVCALGSDHDDVALLQAGLATTDTSCESVVTSGPQNVAAVPPQAQPRDAGPAGYVLLSPCRACFCLYFAMAGSMAGTNLQYP